MKSAASDSESGSRRSPFPQTRGLRGEAGDESTGKTPAVSVIVPFYNEEECVESVLREILAAQPDAEILAIDDGSRDATWETMRAIPGVTALRLTENRGQSAAVYAGLRAAAGDICVLMDGDGQNDPADIGKLVAAVAADECDVACGRRAKRQDTWSRRAASRIANRVRRTFIQDGISDTGCSLKAFRKDCVDLLVPFNGLHRFLPAIFTRAGLRLAEIDVNHRPRSAGISKYTNWERALRGLYDLVGVCWLLKRKVHFPPIERG
ncbi:MAG: glycosyltransferase family 2 protein [Akkermansiaceae bacterium]|nr:glycosyltransferase family 2 protein [Akkermansiaceae bacterium]